MEIPISFLTPAPQTKFVTHIFGVSGYQYFGSEMMRSYKTLSLS